MKYQIETLINGQWDSDAVGTDNVFESKEDAEAGIAELRKLDQFNNLREWADAEYRVVEIEDAN